MTKADLAALIELFTNHIEQLDRSRALLTRYLDDMEQEVDAMRRSRGELRRVFDRFHELNVH